MNVDNCSHDSHVASSSLPTQQSDLLATKTKQPTHIKIYSAAAQEFRRQDAVSIEVAAQDKRGYWTKFIDLFRGKSVVKIQLSSLSAPVYAKTNELAELLGIQKKAVIKQEAKLGELIDERKDLFIRKKYRHRQKNDIKSELESITSKPGKVGSVKSRIELQTNIQSLKSSINKLTPPKQKEFLECIQKFESNVENNPSRILQQQAEFAELEKDVSQALKEVHITNAIKIQKIFRGFRARNQLIQAYIESNFDVRANVPALSQAQVIYMGETHADETHGVRIGWIINHMYKKGDRVLVEDQNKSTPWVMAKTDADLHTQIRYVRKAIEMWGWDNKSDKLMKSLNNIYLLGQILTLLENFLKPETSEIEKRKIFDSSLDIFKKLTIENTAFRSLLGNSQLVEQAFQQIPKLFITFLVKMAYVDVIEDLVKELAETFGERQSSLVNRVKAEINEVGSQIQEQRKEYRKVFLIAGSAHLIDESNQIEKDLALSLQSHRYAILTPKKGQTLSPIDQQKVELLAKKREARKIAVQEKAKSNPSKVQQELTTSAHQLERILTFIKDNTNNTNNTSLFFEWVKPYYS